MNRETSYRISYIILRKAGLTHEAALAMQGNWARESLHDAFRKQGDLSEAAIPSHNYVAAVTTGAISREQFAKDQIGFGLAQWTYYNFDTGKDRGSVSGRESRDVLVQQFLCASSYLPPVGQQA